MKNAMPKWKLSLIIVFASIMLTSSLTAVYATAASNSNLLPDYLVRYAEYLSNGNATQLAIIESEMVTQQKTNQERIAATNGACLNFDPNSQTSLITQSTTIYSQVSSIIATSPPTIDIKTGATVGEILNANGLIGQPDGVYAYLFTDGWTENVNNPIGGEAFADCLMTNQGAYGDMYIYAYTPLPSWNNYVMISGSNNNANWNWIGCAQVSSTTPGWIWTGYNATAYQYVGIECWTPPPYPIYYSPLITHCVYIDSFMTAYP